MQKKASIFKKIKKSIRFRAIIIMILMALIPITIATIAIVQSYKQKAVSIRKAEALSQLRVVSDIISRDSTILTGYSSHNSVTDQINLMSSIYNGRVIVVDETLTVVYDSYYLDQDRIIASEAIVQGFYGKEYVNYNSDSGFIEMSVPIYSSRDSERVIGVVMLSVSTDNVDNTYAYLNNIAIIVLFATLIGAIFFASFLCRQLFLPFYRLRKKTESIKNGYNNVLKSEDDAYETGMIAQEFDEVIAKMRIMDESRQEFVSNVSHELKTPLTSMKVLADSIISMEGAPIELYQEFMQDITNEIERENKIITDLLSLVKMDKSAADLNIDTVNINDLVEQIIKRLQPLAEKQLVEIVLESFRPVTAEIDEVKLTLAISNLIENAIKYNRTDGEGWVHVSLNSDHQYFYLKVEDSGMGIPEDSLDQIYERFYRVDKSHSREIGGTGLGLAITKNSIVMHRGDIQVHSTLGEGTTFDVRIPLNYIV